MIDLNLILTDKQNEAKRKIIYWYKNRTKPYFVLHGVAGSGKSTLVKYILEELGLNNTVTAAFTGMATCVLIKKGNSGARTIHKLIYDVKMFKDEDGKERFKFDLKEDLDDDFQLIIIDEVSMVNKEMIQELLTFGKPILFVGDPEQLQPIFGSNGLTADVFLDEPMRQALDSPIIWLANRVRQKNMSDLRPGSIIGDKVRIYSKDDFPLEVLQNDQILAGKNATVDFLNDFYRKEFLGVSSRQLKNGDKVICLKNNWDKNNSEGFALVNGLIGTAEDISLKVRSQIYEFKFTPAFTSAFEDVYADKLMIDKLTESALAEKSRATKMFRINNKEVINEFKYGYAITVHKSQGSEFDKVTVFNEVLNRRDFSKWCYTAITRSKYELDIIV